MEKTTSLNTLKVGESATVERIAASLDKDLLTKLLPFGFVNGSKVKVKSIAPFGCPMTINIKGSDICLRKKEAQLVVVNI